MPGLGILPPLQNKGLPAGNGKHQRGKHARRTEADHHRPLLREGSRLWHTVKLRWRDDSLFTPALFQHRPLVSLYRNIHGIDYVNLRLLSGIHGTPYNIQLSNLRIGHF